LKRENISGNFLVYYRAKTERTAIADMKKASAPILPQLREIIKRQGQYNISPDSYLFPILSKPGDPIQARRDIQQFIKTTNKYMKLIAEELEIEKPVTTYYARHSYATILMRSGAPVAYISEKLAHHNIKTTQTYLGSFENDTDMLIAQNLIPASNG
jgi:integrase